jgi:hypothetical protein
MLSRRGAIVRKECCNTIGDVVDIIGLQNFTADNPKSLMYLRDGFQGDFPEPRAEHAVAAFNYGMYLFGGITADFDVMQDFYLFDPLSLIWNPVRGVGGGIPPRRSGHSMVTDVSANLIYLFGGKGLQKPRKAGTYIGLNDVWSFNPLVNRWQQLFPHPSFTASSPSAPLGRQHAACAVFNHELYIFGGIDPANNKTFNDLWVFRVGSLAWQPIFSSSSAEGFSPPPLFKASMLPIANQSLPLSDVSSASLLIYGGVAGGGACGDLLCGPLLTEMGQIYVFSLSLGSWVDRPVSVSGQSSPGSLDTAYIEDASWQFGRLSTAAYGAPALSDQGRLLKTFGLEAAIYAPDRGLLYEFGGARAVSTALGSASGQSGQVPFTSPDPTAPADLPPPLLSSSGSQLSPSDQLDWASYEQKQLTEQGEVPANGFWTFTQGFSVSGGSNGSVPANQSVVRFLRAFRVYAVSVRDVVLLHEQRRPPML